MKKIITLLFFWFIPQIAIAQFANVGTFLTDAPKTSASSRTVAVTATLEADNLAVLSVAIDNLTTTDGNTNDITGVTDASGNTWVKAREYTNGQGSAAAGVTVAVFYSVISTQLTTGSNLTISFSGNTTAKAIKGSEFTKASGTIISIDGSADEAVDAGDPGSITLTGASSGQHIWIRALGGENATATFTATAGFTRVNGTATSGSTADTNIMNGWEYKIATGTGSGASNPTSAAGGDWATVMIGLIETAPTATPTATATETPTAPPTATRTRVPTPLATATIRVERIKGYKVKSKSRIESQTIMNRSDLQKPIERKFIFEGKNENEANL